MTLKAWNYISNFFGWCKLYKSRTQIVDFLKELSEEVNERKEYLHRMIEENPNISPKNLVRNLKNCTIIIDDVDDFIDFIKPELNKVAGLFKECENLGVTLVISVHAAKVRGIDEINKIVKQASNGLVLSSQGVTTIFPLTSMKELPKFGDGLLFKNGTYLRVRLPKYEKEVKNGGLFCRTGKSKGRSKKSGENKKLPKSDFFIEQSNG